MSYTSTNQGSGHTVGPRDPSGRPVDLDQLYYPQDSAGIRIDTANTVGHRPDHRPGRGVKGVLAATLLAVSGITGINLSQGEQTTNTPSVVQFDPEMGGKAVSQPKPEKNNYENERGLALDSAVSVARGIIEILQRPKSGAEQYLGTYVGNQKAVIGPDGIFPSDDDNPTPESFVNYNPVTRRLYFGCIKSYGKNPDIKAGNHTKISFDKIEVSLEVNSLNPMAGKNTELTLGDFEKALAAQGTYTLDKMNGALHTDLGAPRQLFYVSPAGVHVYSEADSQNPQRIITAADETYPGTMQQAVILANKTMAQLANTPDTRGKASGTKNLPLAGGNSMSLE